LPIRCKKWEATSFGVLDIAKICHRLGTEGVSKKVRSLSCFVAMIGKMFYIQCITIKILELWLALGSNDS
jgi:hypothetical protein